ncbi:MAG TPA: oligopeptide/dipeptide ABC transporter ATP-binding protein [Syntrophorhabdaceae bacterium]|nr:oligopeptide/dipeptide ABC transporter ATP-binding protein [Syntrophorhabdaceae bacterium]
MAEPLIVVDGLTKRYPVTKGFFKHAVGSINAVDGVSFTIEPGQTFGLVGESGCGKTTLGRLILQTIQPSSGRITFEGRQISFDTKTRPKSLSSKMQVVFQDPYSSLNPRQKIRDIILEPLKIQGDIPQDAMTERLQKLYTLTGLEEDMGERYPHMLSGGQQQRVCIARAMIVQPSFVVCDEPVASLDVSIRAQILNLLKSLQDQLNVSYLFISHDLSVVHYVSHMVAVMYLGKIVEISPKAELYQDPLHPYTRALLSAIPIPDPVLERQRRRSIVQGEVPSALNIPSGCRFHPRCPDAKKACFEEEPALREAKPGHWVNCHT